MAERKNYDLTLDKVGALLTDKRKALGREYRSREGFIERRSAELFAGEVWISERYLANIERGKNWISIEKLIPHAYALEMEPTALFEEILTIITAAKQDTE